MDGWLRVLVAAACVVVLAGGGWYAWGEYSAAMQARQIGEAQEHADLAESDRASSDDYVKCRDSLHSSALGEAKRLRDWCRQNDYITYDEQLRAEGVLN